MSLTIDQMQSQRDEQPGNNGDEVKTPHLFPAGMDIPVMTSASTHGLRSAVGVCAKSGSPYMSSSKYSGGCLKKIVNTVNKTHGSSILNDLNFSKKRKSTNECIILCKRKSPQGRDCSNQCFSVKNRNGKIKSVQSGGLTDEVSKKYGKGSVLDSEFLSKIKSGDFFEPSRALSESLYTGEGNAICRRVEKSGNDPNSSISKPVATTSSFVGDNNNNGNGKILNSDKNITTSISGESRKLKNCIKNGLMNVNGDEKESGSNLIWQPKHLVTRRTAQISREVLRVWRARFGSSSCVTTGQVPLLLKDLQLVASKSEVHKSLEKSGREISFEEFCRFLAESGCLKFCDTGLPRTVPEPRKFGKNGSHQQPRRGRKLPKAMCKYDVFLGGSCNPTTWRADIAIPDLKKMGITYFNPVSQWRPDLLEVEYHAKENAAVMFFVIDNQTRGISALIEVAHIAGSKRNLILVIQSYTREKQIISGEIVSHEECDDLRNGQEVLRDLVESQGIPVFDNIRVALKHTEKLLRGKSTADDDEDDKQPGEWRRQARLQKIEPREVFDALAVSENRQLSVNDVSLALRMMDDGRETPDPEEVARILGTSSESAASESVSFERFSSLVTALGYTRDDAESHNGLYLIPKLDIDRQLSPIRDVYIGGTLKDSSWKDDIAVPLLKKHGLSFFNPRVSEWSSRFLPVEAAAIRNSYILLFVITDSARSIAEMAVAGYYIGMGARMVLCIQHFPKEATVGIDKLTENAVKDYNRGRMYLADIAKRNGVRIFSDVSEAVKCVIEECQNRCPD